MVLYKAPHATHTDENSINVVESKELGNSIQGNNQEGDIIPFVLRIQCTHPKEIREKTEDTKNEGSQQVSSSLGMMYNNKEEGNSAGIRWSFLREENKKDIK